MEGGYFVPTFYYNALTSKGKTIVCPLFVNLNELHNGSIRKMKIQKNIICDKCNGEADGVLRKCHVCNGVGVKTQNHFSMYCYRCRGLGIIFIPKICNKCSGKKTVVVEEEVTIQIDKGVASGHRIVYSGYGNQEPGLEAGDIVFVVYQMKHKKFLRIDNDLYMRIQINLVEALCGFKKSIHTLDYKYILISTNPGQVIHHKHILCIPGKGMPTYENPSKKGRLVIQFYFPWPSIPRIPPEILPFVEACFLYNDMVEESAEEERLMEQN